MTLLKTVVECVTSEGFITRYSPRIAKPQPANPQGGLAALSRKDGETLNLDLVHRYTVAEVEGEHGPWTVSTAEYIYEVSDQSDDLIATFHWLPLTARAGDGITRPHIRFPRSSDAPHAAPADRPRLDRRRHPLPH